LLVKLRKLELRRRLFRLRHRHSYRDGALGLKSRIDLEQSLEAAAEQPRRD